MLTLLLAQDFGGDYRWIAGIVFAVLAIISQIFQSKQEKKPGDTQSGGEEKNEEITVILGQPPRPPRPPRNRPTPEPVTRRELPPTVEPKPIPTYHEPKPVSKQPAPPQRRTAQPRPVRRQPPTPVPQRRDPVHVEYEPPPIARPMPAYTAAPAPAAVSAAYELTRPAESATVAAGGPVVGQRSASRQMQSILRLLSHPGATRSVIILNEILRPPLALRDDHLSR